MGGNNGNGKATQFGQPARNGEVFRRGPDHLPRGSVKLMGQVWLLDEREAIYQNGVRLLRNPRTFLAMLEFIADRLEGRPIQTVHMSQRRTTIFEPAAAATPEPAGTPGATPGTPTKSIAGGSELLPYVPLRPQA